MSFVCIYVRVCVRVCACERAERGRGRESSLSFVKRELLGSQQNWDANIESPQTPCPHTSTAPAPTVNISHRSGTFVTINESLLLHQHWKFTLAVRSMDFDKCIRTSIHYYIITWNCFTELKIPCVMSENSGFYWYLLVLHWEHSWKCFSKTTVASVNKQVKSFVFTLLKPVKATD